MRVVELRTNDGSGLIATAFRRPAFAWRLEGGEGLTQVAYELQRAWTACFTDDVIASARIDTACPFGAPFVGPDLASREVAWVRVRAWTNRGATDWSDPLRIEGGLFDPADWLARPISPRSNCARLAPGPVPLLRREFSLSQPVAHARLYVSALGLQECWINGQGVSRDLLEPGWTAYGERLQYAAYDVTHLLQSGTNAIAAAVGDGWWRGKLTWLQRRAVYGDTTALLAQLEMVFADGSREIIASDESWRGGFGGLRMADIYDGCDVDLGCEPTAWKEPGFDDGDWEPVIPLPLPHGLEQRSAPAVKIVEVRTAMVEQNGRVVRVDCGQNLTGFLRLTVRASLPGKLTVRHAEVLEPDGGLHTAALRGARATDSYVVPTGSHVLQPSFTYHGFRFAEIELGEGIEVDKVEVCVVSSDLARIGHFSCSDGRLNQLASNIAWSQLANFVALPTDCPQRDERLGWTGDIQVFAPTACFNFDSRAFLASWLIDLAIEQAPDGNVPSTVPNVIQGHPFEYGGIGWADAATLVPWALYEAYGDQQVLERQFPSMQAWVDYGIGRLDALGIWVGDFHLGDWLDPGAPPDRPEDATTDRDYIASCYLAHSTRVVARAAAILGHAELAARYALQGDRIAAATWSHWRESALQTQAGCALAICFEIAPEDERGKVGAALAGLVEANGGRIATGFLGTPVVLPALARTGQYDAAWQLLLNEDTPGWLYQVKMGATTMWERWDAIRPDGTLHGGAMAAEDADSMTSFNHYAYGCVGEWLYRTVAGIAPAAPGYREIAFAPVPGGGLSWAEARLETPFGLAAIEWKVSQEELRVEIEVPPGASATFSPPPGWHASKTHPASLKSGRHSILLVRRNGSEI